MTRRARLALVTLVAATCVAACLGGCAAGSQTRAGTDTGLQLHVRQSVLVTDEPLGDVVTDQLDAGEQVTAVCFVRAARTNTGARGTAIRISTGRRSGYAATTDFADPPSARTMTFDVSEDELRRRLPACE